MQSSPTFRSSLCAILCRRQQTRDLCGRCCVLGLLLVVCMLAGCGVTPGPGIKAPIVWLQQYGAQQLSTSAETFGYGPEAPTTLATDTDGNVLVGGYVAGSFAGFTGTPGLVSAYLAKYSADGTQQWLRQYAAPGGTLLTGVATDAQNNIAVVGANFSSSSLAQIVATKLDPNGNPLWVQSIPAQAGISFGEQVKIAADGSVIVAGAGLFDYAAGETIFAAKLAAADGSPIWAEAYTLPNAGTLTGMALDAQGNAMIIGNITGGDASYPFVIKLQSDGTLAWLHQISTVPNGVLVSALTTDASGNPLVAGSSYGGPLTTGFAADVKQSAILYKFNAADGSELWHRTYSTGKGDSMTGIESAPDGSLYAVGYTNGHFNQAQYDPHNLADIFLLVLASDGTQKQARQFGTGPLLNTTTAYGPQTALDASGNLFISGPTTGAYTGFANATNALQMFIAKLDPASLPQ